MRKHQAILLLVATGVLHGGSARAKAVEDFQVVAGNEAHVADDSEVLYFENQLWLQKSWASFSRDKHTFFAGTDLLLEPITNDWTGATRFGVDTIAIIAGYKLNTYLPDWYNFAIQVRVPVAVAPDPFGRQRCDAEPELDPGAHWAPVAPVPCAPYRRWVDRLELTIDPLFIKKTWNLFAIHDRNRIKLNVESIEYSNKVKFIDITPDLEFPIAMYAGNELRLRKNLTEPGGRVRNDFIVGLASNFFDWVHLGVEAMYHLDSKPEASRAFIAEIYLELYFEVFFDNTFGAMDQRARMAHEEARD